MEDKEALYHLIEQHLEGKLSEQDQTAFEKRIANDPELMAEVKLHEELKKNISDTSLMDFKEKIAAAENDYFGHSKDNPFVRHRASLIAAALLLLLSVSFLIKYFDQPPMTGGELFTAYFEPYTNVISVRGADSEKRLESAMALYDKGNYPLAINQLEQLDTAERPMVAFYLGISHLAADNHVLAKPYFEKFAFSKNNPLGPAASWYLALAHLKTGDYEKAKVLLTRVLAFTSNEPYKPMAKEILKHIDKM